MTRPRLLVRSEPWSLGGILLAGLLLVLAALVYFSSLAPDTSVLQQATLWLLLAGSGLYLMDVGTEYVALDGRTLEYDSWLKRRRRYDLDGIAGILLVYEGFNLERGFYSLILRRKDGDEVRLSLGPLWRRQKLEAFLQEVERRTGDVKLVEEVR